MLKKLCMHTGNIGVCVQGDLFKFVDPVVSFHELISTSTGGYNKPQSKHSHIIFQIMGAHKISLKSEKVSQKQFKSKQREKENRRYQCYRSFHVWF